MIQCKFPLDEWKLSLCCVGLSSGDVKDVCVQGCLPYLSKCVCDISSLRSTKTVRIVLLRWNLTLKGQRQKRQSSISGLSTLLFVGVKHLSETRGPPNPEVAGVCQTSVNQVYPRVSVRVILRKYDGRVIVGSNYSGQKCFEAYMKLYDMLSQFVCFYVSYLFLWIVPRNYVLKPWCLNTSFRMDLIAELSSTVSLIILSRVA